MTRPSREAVYHALWGCIQKFSRGRDLHIKQHRKRVSALLLALCMVLSLVMPVSALDGQVQAERREGYDVAAIHYTDGEGDE